MTSIFGPESDFPITEDVSEVCSHAFQIASSMHAEGEEGLIRLINGCEVIGRLTQNRRQVLIWRNSLDARPLGEDLYEVEFLKPDHTINKESGDLAEWLDRRFFVSPENPYEFFEVAEDGNRYPIGRAHSKHYAELIARSNLTTLPEI